MPRRRKLTPAHTPAVQPVERTRRRARTPAAGAVLIKPAAPAVRAPLAAEPVVAAEERDRRPFRERVASRRGSVGLLLFRVGQETFGAELGAVEEAVEVPSLHGLPEMQTGMLGMFDLRGRLLPVFSAADVLGVPLMPGATATLVIRAGDRRIGVAVDDVDDVIEADCSALRAVPGSPDQDGVFLAVLQRGTALASIIDAPALVAACLAAHTERR